MSTLLPTIQEDEEKYIKSIDEWFEEERLINQMTKERSPTCQETNNKEKEEEEEEEESVLIDEVDINERYMFDMEKVRLVSQIPLKHFKSKTEMKELYEHSMKSIAREQKMHNLKVVVIMKEQEARIKTLIEHYDSLLHQNELLKDLNLKVFHRLKEEKEKTKEQAEAIQKLQEHSCPSCCVLSS
jgi:hypothetical protein